VATQKDPGDIKSEQFCPRKKFVFFILEIF